MSMEDAVIVANETEYCGKGIIAGDQWEDLGVLTGEVIDLKVA